MTHVQTQPAPQSLAAKVASLHLRGLPRMDEEKLIQLAVLFAAEIHFDPEAALLIPRDWYRHQVGEDRCSKVDAWEIRSRVIEACIRTRDARLDACIVGRNQTMRDFARQDVRDADANRARRDKLIRSLPNRIQTGVVGIDAAPGARPEAPTDPPRELMLRFAFLIGGILCVLGALATHGR